MSGIDDEFERQERHANWIILGLVVLGLWLVTSVIGGCQARVAQCERYGYDKAGQEC